MNVLQNSKFIIFSIYKTAQSILHTPSKHSIKIGIIAAAAIILTGYPNWLAFLLSSLWVGSVSLRRSLNELKTTNQTTQASIASFERAIRYTEKNNLLTFVNKLKPEKQAFYDGYKGSKSWTQYFKDCTKLNNWKHFDEYLASYDVGVENEYHKHERSNSYKII